MSLGSNIYFPYFENSSNQDTDLMMSKTFCEAQETKKLFNSITSSILNMNSILSQMNSQKHEAPSHHIYSQHLIQTTEEIFHSLNNSLKPIKDYINKIENQTITVTSEYLIDKFYNFIIQSLKEFNSSNFDFLIQKPLLTTFVIILYSFLRIIYNKQFNNTFSTLQLAFHKFHLLVESITIPNFSFLAANISTAFHSCFRKFSLTDENVLTSLSKLTISSSNSTIDTKLMHENLTNFRADLLPHLQSFKDEEQLFPRLLSSLDIFEQSITYYETFSNLKSYCQPLIPFKFISPREESVVFSLSSSFPQLLSQFILRSKKIYSKLDSSDLEDYNSFNDYLNQIPESDSHSIQLINSNCISQMMKDPDSFIQESEHLFNILLSKIDKDIDHTTFKFHENKEQIESQFSHILQLFLSSKKIKENSKNFLELYAIRMQMAAEFPEIEPYLISTSALLKKIDYDSLVSTIQAETNYLIQAKDLQDLISSLNVKSVDNLTINTEISYLHSTRDHFNNFLLCSNFINSVQTLIDLHDQIIKLNSDIPLVESPNVENENLINDSSAIIEISRMSRSFILIFKTPEIKIINREKFFSNWSQLIDETLQEHSISQKAASLPQLLPFIDFSVPIRNLLNSIFSLENYSRYTPNTSSHLRKYAITLRRLIANSFLTLEMNTEINYITSTLFSYISQKSEYQTLMKNINDIQFNYRLIFHILSVISHLTYTKTDSHGENALHPLIILNIAKIIHTDRELPSNCFSIGEVIQSLSDSVSSSITDDIMKLSQYQLEPEEFKVKVIKFTDDCLTQLAAREATISEHNCLKKLLGIRECVTNSCSIWSLCQIDQYIKKLNVPEIIESQFKEFQNYIKTQINNTQKIQITTFLADVILSWHYPLVFGDEESSDSGFFDKQIETIINESLISKLNETKDRDLTLKVANLSDKTKNNGAANSINIKSKCSKNEDLSDEHIFELKRAPLNLDIWATSQDELTTERKQAIKSKDDFFIIPTRQKMNKSYNISNDNKAKITEDTYLQMSIQKAIAKQNEFDQKEKKYKRLISYQENLPELLNKIQVIKKSMSEVMREIGDQKIEQASDAFFSKLSTSITPFIEYSELFSISSVPESSQLISIRHNISKEHDEFIKLCDQLQEIQRKIFEETNKQKLETDELMNENGLISLQERLEKIVWKDSLKLIMKEHKMTKLNEAKKLLNEEERKAKKMKEESKSNTKEWSTLRDESLLKTLQELASPEDEISLSNLSNNNNDRNEKLLKQLMKIDKENDELEKLINDDQDEKMLTNEDELQLLLTKISSGDLLSATAPSDEVTVGAMKRIIEDSENSIYRLKKVLKLREEYGSDQDNGISQFLKKKMDLGITYFNKEGLEQTKEVIDRLIERKNSI